MNKTIYVRPGEVLKVECLINSASGEPILMLRTDRGLVAITTRFDFGGVIFDVDEDVRKFKKDSFEYAVLQQLITLNVEGLVSVKSIRDAFNASEDMRFGVTSNTISKVLRTLGFEIVRKADGWYVDVNKKNLNRATLKFE